MQSLWFVVPQNKGPLGSGRERRKEKKEGTFPVFSLSSGDPITLPTVGNLCSSATFIFGGIARDLLKHRDPLDKKGSSPLLPAPGQELGFGLEGNAPLCLLPTWTSGPYIESSQQVVLGPKV